MVHARRRNQLTASHSETGGGTCQGLEEATWYGGETNGSEFVMLNIRQVKHLAANIGFSLRSLNEIAENADDFCEELLLLDPAKPDKRRLVLDVRGDLRKVQDRQLRGVFMRKLSPSPNSHGGIRGRHIKTNVQLHADSVFVFTTDICNFYPTVSHNRVYRLFVQQLGCTPDVARILTRLCTYRHHLALGLVTSPFLAEQILLSIDRRIHAACNGAGLKYSRYVDDLAISGGFNLAESGFSASVSSILGDHGFEMHPDKSVYGRLAEGTPITKITIRNGHPDVRREYLEELNRQLDDANNLANGGALTGLYFTKNQIAGRVRFVSWINPGRRRQLVARLNSIDWNKVAQEAAIRGLYAAKKRLVKQGAESE
jgi:RNA-directed DNA polymerase